MGNSVSVALACWGEQYVRFQDRWWESLKNVKRQPDEIVIVAGPQVRDRLFTVPTWVESKVILIEGDCLNPHEWWHLALHSTSGDYILPLGLDDQFGENALNFAEETDADLIIDSVQFIQGGDWPAVWEPDAPFTRRFAPAAVSPFHRRLLPIWDKIPKDCYWDDYVWYLLLAKEQVSVYRTEAVRMMHDLGNSHQTMSGVLLPIDTRIEADQQLNRIRQELSI